MWRRVVFSGLLAGAFARKENNEFLYRKETGSRQLTLSGAKYSDVPQKVCVVSRCPKCVLTQTKVDQVQMRVDNPLRGVLPASKRARASEKQRLSAGWRVGRGMVEGWRPRKRGK